MSQTTQCPACHTRFKVVADQLRISDGWVRCGDCHEVFDATDSLEALAAPTPPGMLPHLNLQDLRGPVQRVPAAAPAPRAAWQQAGPPEASAQSRESPLSELAPSVSSSLPSLQPIRADVYVHRDAFVRAQASDDYPPDFENTVPAGLFPDFEPEPSATEQPRNNAPQVHAAPGAVDFQSGDEGLREAYAPLSRALPTPFVSALGHPSLENTDAAHPARQGRAEATTGKTAGPPLTGDEPLHGYELPGSQDDPDADDWPLFADSIADALTDAARQKSEPQPRGAGAADPEEPDLAHFIAEVSDWQDSRFSTRPATQAAHLGSEGGVSHWIEPTLESERFLVQDEPTASRSDALSLADRDATWQLINADAEVDFSAGTARSARNRGLEGAAELDEPLVDSEWDEAAESASLPDFQEAPEPSFVRRARRRALWAGARVRASLWLAALMLSVLLLGQAAVHHRDLLAVQFPLMRPMLVSLCESLGCAVQANRNIGAILVDGSSFNRTQGDRYQFLLTLRNQTQLPVQAPVIELTLTDVQDQPVVRRVLQADELNLPEVFQPQQEWSGEMPMIMAPGTARIAGYRVLAFYPN